MIQLVAEERCTGCMACAAICPCSAIIVVQDALGGLYPEINESRCVGCGRCQKVCPQLNQIPAREPSRAFAVWSLNAEDRKTSASGGAASVFYEKALEQGYWICGAEYLPEGRVIHTLTKDRSAISRYKQSKYVFSETVKVYSEIKNHLDAGGKVIVISLPCKIAGLFRYLQKTYENLITVDIVCHGTPSGKLLIDHIKAVAPDVKEFRLTFRQDNEFQFRLECDGKVNYRKIGRTDTYLAAFLDGLSYRESCYHCSYAKNERISDITICDFWGLGAEIPFNHPYTGAISAVLINTERGQSLFNDCRELLFVEERSVGEAIKGNAQLNKPTPKPENRDEFIRLYQQYGFESTVKTLLRPIIKAEQKQLRYMHLKKGVRKLAGVFIKRYRG